MILIRRDLIGNVIDWVSKLGVIWLDGRLVLGFSFVDIGFSGLRFELVFRGSFEVFVVLRFLLIFLSVIKLFDFLILKFVIFICLGFFDSRFDFGLVFILSLLFSFLLII